MQASGSGGASCSRCDGSGVALLPQPSAKLHQSRPLDVGSCWHLGQPHEKLSSGSSSSLCSARRRCRPGIDRCGVVVAESSCLARDGSAISGFQPTSSPTNQDLQHTALLDSRWIDIYLGHLKEVDSYQEAKKKLGKIGKTPKEEEVPKVPKPKPAPKVKAAAKQRAAGAGSASEEAA